MTDLSPILDPPGVGRAVTTQRCVRLGDVRPSGRLRLDAVARYLQDVANDDAAEVMGADAMGWIVRRTTLAVHAWPVFDEHLDVTTWGSGSGSRWAERRTSIIGADGGRIEAASLWIFVDVETGRPKRLTPDFHAIYDEALGGRQVAARLVHRDPPPDGATRPGPAWTVRRTDLDLFDHVNNSHYWSIAEETWPLDETPLPWHAEIEHRDGLVHGQSVTTERTDDQLWILGDGTIAATIRVA